MATSNTFPYTDVPNVPLYMSHTPPPFTTDQPLQPRPSSSSIQRKSGCGFKHSNPDDDPTIATPLSSTLTVMGPVRDPSRMLSRTNNMSTSTHMTSTWAPTDTIYKSSSKDHYSFPPQSRIHGDTEAQQQSLWPSDPIGQYPGFFQGYHSQLDVSNLATNMSVVGSLQFVHFSAQTPPSLPEPEDDVPLTMLSGLSLVDRPPPPFLPLSPWSSSTLVNGPSSLGILTSANIDTLSRPIGEIMFSMPCVGTSVTQAGIINPTSHAAASKHLHSNSRGRHALTMTRHVGHSPYRREWNERRGVSVSFSPSPAVTHSAEQRSCDFCRQRKVRRFPRI